jgi:hypothetical protein
MALKLVNQAGNALGQFDGKDDEVLELKGGEVVTFASVAVDAADKAAKDVFDGYTMDGATEKRVYVTKSLSSSSRPLMLADDGISGYGTLFGTVVGGTVGQSSFGLDSVVPASALLGPHTATGSGKVTCWHLPGVYAVSLDACDDDEADGLQPTNSGITTGQALTFTADGLLTPVGSPSAVGGAPVVGTLIDFESKGSLVTTPNKLVTSLVDPKKFNYAVFYFNPPVA